MSIFWAGRAFLKEPLAGLCLEHPLQDGLHDRRIPMAALYYNLAEKGPDCQEYRQARDRPHTGTLSAFIFLVLLFTLSRTSISTS